MSCRVKRPCISAVGAVCLLSLCGLYGYVQLYERQCRLSITWDDVTKYAPGTVLSLVTKNVIVRSAYFDDRSRSGHTNASVFMVEALRDVVDQGLIVGCQVGEFFGEFIQVRPVALMDEFVHWKHAYVNHDLLMVDCFNIPASAKNGSRAFLFVKHKSATGASQVRVVESERPFLVPAPRIARGDDIKLLVCVATARYVLYNRRLTLYDQIYHWLNYQRAIGVDHVHFTAHPSFVSAGSLQNDVIRKAIADNFVSFEFWEPWLNETDNYHGHSQMLAYEDCAYRFRGTYDYIMMCDTDDFFVPRISHERTFSYYIKKWCHYGACRFHWIERYPDCGFNWDRLGKDGNLTAILKSKTALRLNDNKSLYRSSMVLDVGIHRPMDSMSGYHIIHVPSDVAYFAHVRPVRLPAEGSTC